MTEPVPDPLQDPRLAGFRAGLAGRYQIVRQIGEGGMAVVLLARDLQHDRNVALKVLHPELTRSLGGERFHQEIRLTAKVQHPHIVSIYDSGETDGHLWYSMPFIEGESLRQRLVREEQLPLPEALRITIEAGRALAAAHQAGIVHRDIKPENLLLTSAGDVYLVDFGVARAVDSASLTRTGLAVGTPQYMSPEQASGKTEVSARSDVYTLGCVLYEMLAGEPPYNSRTPQGVSAKHLQSPIPDVRIIRETVSHAVQQVLQTALAKSPADRYRDAGAMADALEQAMSAPKRLFSWKTRKHAAIVAAALAISFGGYRAISAWQPKHPVAPTIAVLYFENPEADSSLNTIVDGATEELIRELTGAASAFRVVSKFGVRPFKNRNVPVDSMRTLLKADYWVAGEIRRVGPDIVVQAQLIEARTNIVIDSLSARSSGRNPHELAANAAISVAASLKKKLNLEVRLAAPGDHSSSPLAGSLEDEAQRLTREAEYFATLPDSHSVASAILALDRADSLLARASRADTTWLKPWITRSAVGLARARLEPGPEQIPILRRAMEFAEEAVRRAPDEASALEVRGTIRYRISRGLNDDDTTAFRLVERDLRDAVGRDSLRASAWATLGDLLWLLGRLDESDLALRTALEADPFLTDAYRVKTLLFNLNLFQGKFDKAGEVCRRLRIEYPENWFSQQCVLTLLRHDTSKPPDTALAWKVVALLDSIDPADKARAAGHPYPPLYRRILAASLDARAGNTAKAEAGLVWARRAAAGDSIMQVDMALDEAYLLLVLGRPKEARGRVQRYISARPTQVPALMRDQLYRQILALAIPASTAPR